MDFEVGIYDKFADCRLSIKKKNVRFIELLFRFNDIEIAHDRIIEIAYNFDTPINDNEQKFKNYLLAYEYVINSNNNDMDINYLKKIYYLFKETELNEEIGINIISHYYAIDNCSKIEKAIIFHYFLDKIFQNEEMLFRIVFSLVFLTREMLKVGLSTFKMIDFQYKEYLAAKETYLETKNIIPTFILMEKIYKEEQTQSIQYLENTTELTIKDIKNAILSISELLEKYKITYVLLFGSFTKNLQRTNSDVDLYINVIEDVSYKEKEKRIEVVKEVLCSKLNRYVDIQELGKPILINLLKEIKNSILIYRKE